MQCRIVTWRVTARYRQTGPAPAAARTSGVLQAALSRGGWHRSAPRTSMRGGPSRAPSDHSQLDGQPSSANARYTASFDVGDHMGVELGSGCPGAGEGPCSTDHVERLIAPQRFGIGRAVRSHRRGARLKRRMPTTTSASERPGVGGLEEPHRIGESHASTNLGG